MNAQTYTVATTVADPLTAEHLVTTLQQAGLDAFSRPGGAASSAPFAATQGAFWDILAPSEQLDDTRKLIDQVLKSIEDNASMNAAAADDEAMSGEHAIET